MLNSKYYCLQELVFRSYIIDCPVEIEKGSLFLDTQTKAVSLQLKLTVQGNNYKEISSVTLKIFGFDDAGDEVQGINPIIYTYMDVFLLGEKSFGENTSIIVDPRIRRIKVDLARVVMLNGNIWKFGGSEITPPEQKPISTLRNDLLEQLKRDTGHLQSKEFERVEFFPKQLDEYWLCTCGRPNNNTADKCTRCNLSKEWTFKFVNEMSIQTRLNSYLEKVQLEQERVQLEKERVQHQEEELARKRELERIRKLQEERIHNKRRNALLIILASIGISIAIFFFVVLQYINYSQASKFLAEKDYNRAIYMFDSLGDFMNSKEMVSEAVFQKANFFDSSYQLALRYYEQGDFVLAKEAFTGISDYKDSNNYLLKLDTLIGIQGTWGSLKFPITTLKFNKWKYTVIKDTTGSKSYILNNDLITSTGLNFFISNYDNGQYYLDKDIIEYHIGSTVFIYRKLK